MRSLELVESHGLPLLLSLPGILRFGDCGLVGAVPPVLRYSRFQFGYQIIIVPWLGNEVVASTLHSLDRQ